METLTTDGLSVRQQQIVSIAAYTGSGDQKTGAAPADFGALFGGLEADPPGALDGVRDMANMPLDGEPPRVRDDLDAVISRRHRGG